MLYLKPLASCRSPTALKRPDRSKQRHCLQFAKCNASHLYYSKIKTLWEFLWIDKFRDTKIQNFWAFRSQLCSCGHASGFVKCCWMNAFMIGDWPHLLIPLLPMCAVEIAFMYRQLPTSFLHGVRCWCNNTPPSTNAWCLEVDQSVITTHSLKVQCRTGFRTRVHQCLILSKECVAISDQPCPSSLLLGCMTGVTGVYDYFQYGQLLQ